MREGVKKAVLGTLKPRAKPADTGRQQGAV
jgi:hypothetical protein